MVFREIPGKARDQALCLGDILLQHADDRLQMSFLRLTAFCIKVVFAAIPAIVILTVLLWLGGQALATFFPQLPRMQIFVHFPKV